MQCRQRFLLGGKPKKVVIEVEEQQRILREAHEGTGEFEDGETERHNGRTRTLDKFSGKYYWVG